MDLYVNPTITKFAQKVDGEITELKLGVKQEDAYAQIFEKGAESGGGKVENNKAATIDVSTYTEPVVITPTSGKNSMKKATITLSNIPSPSGTVIFQGYKDPNTGNIVNTNTTHTGIIIVFDGEGLVPQFTFSYDSENDKVTISGGSTYVGIYERDIASDLYANI